MKRSEIAFGIIKIPVDLLMTILAFVVGYYLRTFPNLIPGLRLQLDLTQFTPLDEYMHFASGAALLLFVLFAINGMYSLKSSVRLSKEIGKVIVLTATWFLLIIAYFFIIRQFPFSRLALGYTWVLTIIFITIGRIIIYSLQRILLKFGIGKRRIAFLGINKISEELYNFFNKDNHFTVLGVIDDAKNNGEDKTKLKYMGTIQNLENIIKKYNIEELIQTKSDISKTDAGNILEFCREHHVLYHFVPDLVQVQRTNIEIASPNGIPLISLKPTPLDGWGKVSKRIFDIIGSTLGLIIFSPIFLITAIAIKLDSKGTIIFKYLDDGSRVKRVGQYGKLFNFYKFRSMYPNTHNLRYTKLAHKNMRKGSPMVKIEDDPRVTRVGKFIRKWDIDELPQLWNVLKGDMSLVGPRPHLPEEVEKYEKHHKFVLSLKPGITGLAQISGRSDLDFEKEVKLDTYYIENWSLWLDIKIIIKTFGVVLTRKGKTNKNI
jgi:exopolysaccharide biosynthesis polyprenyl glycosylphosphotransferase